MSMSQRTFKLAKKQIRNDQYYGAKQDTRGVNENQFLQIQKINDIYLKKPVNYNIYATEHVNPNDQSLPQIY